MTQSQGVALGWHVPRRWRSSPAAVKTSITWPWGSVKSEGRRMKETRLNFIIHTSSFCLSTPCIRSQAMPCFSSITAMACAVSKVGLPWPPLSV
jgi:hypothetical protein